MTYDASSNVLLLIHVIVQPYVLRNAVSLQFFKEEYRIETTAEI